MSHAIRHFRNTDTLHLTRIWNLHHSTTRSSQPIANSVFDACVISKPYFRAEDLLLFEEDEQPVGFVHLGFGCDATRDRIDYRHALLGCLCVEPHRNEEEIADRLIDAAVVRLAVLGSSDLISVGSTTRYAFYMGMMAGDGMMGVVASDSRLQRWLVHNRFEPIRPTECWEVELGRFRPPMDRGQFAVRRGASVVRVLDDIQEDWWDAVVLGHAEQIRFQLYSKQPSALINDVLFWYTEPTWTGIASQAVRVWLPKFPEDADGRERFVFLLSEAFRYLQSERFSVVRTVAAPDELASVSVLQRLGFRSVEQGLIFQRRLNNPV